MIRLFGQTDTTFQTNGDYYLDLTTSLRSVNGNTEKILKVYGSVNGQTKRIF